MRPILLGHRGARASQHIPENTLASFELCLEHGCDGFEFDVRRSADGVAVICHDPVVGAVEIEATPAARLGLPTLDTVLRQFSGRAFLDIELKVAGLESQAIAALREHPPAKGYVVSSFLPQVLRAVHDLDRSVRLGLLWEDRKPTTDLPFDWLVPHLELLDRGLVEEAHAAGMKVMTWTVNDPEHMRQFADLGVDAIISDDTQSMVGALGKL
jgi:glycerophosphoryl diester phosphodiesterase